MKEQGAGNVRRWAERATIDRQASNIERAVRDGGERLVELSIRFEGKISWVSGHSRPHVRFPGDPRNKKCE
mgnify:CR=1 FL=1